MNTDVIVVGAGPAGSTAASFLARKGIKTLLLDRATFPRLKPCGDAISVAAYPIFEAMGLRRATIEAKKFYRVNHMMHRNLQDEVSQIHLSNTDFSTSEVLVCPRYEFDEMLFKHALSCGAIFEQAHIEAPIIENGQVVGVTGKQNGVAVTYRAQVVIVADGATSAVARVLTPKRRASKHTAVAIRGYVDTVSDLTPTIEFDFMPETLPGYAWFFPITKRRANIGIGIRADFYKYQVHSLKAIVEIYRQKPYMRERIGTNPIQNLKAWPIPLFSFDTQRVFDGAILIGDAGCFVNQITGDGIYEALVTGQCAAEVICDAFTNGDFSRTALAAFDNLWHTQLGERFREAEILNDLATLAPNIIARAIFYTNTTN